MSGLTHGQGELLAQVRPSVTTAVQLLKAAELAIEVTLIMVAVPSTGPATVTVRLYHDDSGGDSWTDANLIRSRDVTQNFDELFQAQHPGSGIHIKRDGSLGIAISEADDAIISVYGITETLADRVNSRVR